MKPIFDRLQISIVDSMTWKKYYACFEINTDFADINFNLLQQAHAKLLTVTQDCKNVLC